MEIQQLIKDARESLTDLYSVRFDPNFRFFYPADNEWEKEKTDCLNFINDCQKVIDKKMSEDELKACWLDHKVARIEPSTCQYGDQILFFYKDGVKQYRIFDSFDTESKMVWTTVGTCIDTMKYNIYKEIKPT